MNRQGLTDLVFCSRPKESGPDVRSERPEVRPSSQKRALEDSDGTTDTLSKNKQKKQARNPYKNFALDLRRESSLPSV